MEIDINDDIHQQRIDPTQMMEESTDNQELQQQSAQIRGAIYSFLSSLYLQAITEESLRQICDKQFLSELAQVLPGDATTKFREYLSGLHANDISDEVAILKQEYMSLFTVPTGRYVTPFEDIYRGKTADGQPHRGPLLGVRAIAAKQLYREAGAELDAVTKELPNHIGVELSFMRFLCEREAAALNDSSDVEQENTVNNRFTQAEIYRAYQIRFLSEHLTRWFPQLNEEIQKKSDHRLYKSVSNMTQEFLQQNLQDTKQQLSSSIQ